MKNIELKTCEICGFQTENGKVMSNHKRWQHIMPKGSPKYESTCKNIGDSGRKERITKTCFCKKCGKPFEQTLLLSEWKSGKNAKAFCSSKCAHSRAQTEETKQKILESTRDYLLRCGLELKCKDKTCPNCGNVFHSRHTFCSASCATMYRHSQYIKNVGRSLKTYRQECAFTFALNLYPEEFDFKLVEKFGWYAPKNSSKPNLNGVSRDHMVSVKWGWEHKIDPKIISHPANCRLILQSNNSSKRDDCSISYEELLKRIEVWNKKYGVS